MSERTPTPRELMLFIAGLFDSGSSGYYLSAGDWKLVAPYVLDLQDIAAEKAELTRQNRILSNAVQSVIAMHERLGADQSIQMRRPEFIAELREALKSCGGGVE